MRNAQMACPAPSRLLRSQGTFVSLSEPDKSAAIGRTSSFAFWHPGQYRNFNPLAANPARLDEL